MPERDNGTAALPAELIEKLDRIGNLMALTMVRRLKDAEQIRVLAAVGYRPAEIGAFLGKEPNAVSQALFRQKKKSTGKKQAETKPARKRTARGRRS